MKRTQSTVYVLWSMLILTQPAWAETIIGGEVGNGNFESDDFAEKVVAYQDVSHWHLIGGNDAATTFGTVQGTNGSPDGPAGDRSVRQTGYLFDTDDSVRGNRYAANDTGYTIQSAGAVFSVEMALHQFGRQDNYHGDEYIEAVLFTATGPVGPATNVQDITVLGSTQLLVAGQWTVERSDAFYSTTSEDVGKTVYLGLELVDPKLPEGNRRIFPRFDAVRLTVEAGEADADAAVDEPS